MSEPELFTRLVNQLDYASNVTRSREVFLLSYGEEFRAFEFLLQTLQSIWVRICRERDQKSHSHSGLWLMASLLIRHCVFGFQQLVSYQSFLAWLSFRPGLEALLIMGKWVDDRKNAKIWRNRQDDPQTYSKTFSGRNLVSRSLPEADGYRQVLGRLNDQFVHPNPYFAYRESDVRIGTEKTLVLATRYFDTSESLHLAHLLAFLHVFEKIVRSSDEMVRNILGHGDALTQISPISDIWSDRAKRLAETDGTAKAILRELGLWKFP